MSLDCVSRTIGGLLCIANAGIFATLVGMATVSVGKYHGVIACDGARCAIVTAQTTATGIKQARVSQLAVAADQKKI